MNIGRAFVRDLDGEGVGAHRRAVTLAPGIGRRAPAEGIETGRRRRLAPLGGRDMPVLVATDLSAAGRPLRPLPAAGDVG